MVHMNLLEVMDACVVELLATKNELSALRERVQQEFDDVQEQIDAALEVDTLGLVSL